MSRKWSNEERKAFGEMMAQRRAAKKTLKGQKDFVALHGPEGEVGRSSLPVPVLADKLYRSDSQSAVTGEARESNTKDRSRLTTQDSRGGQTTSLSKTDQKFWSLRPGWYDFCKDGEWRRRCENCDESFQTRLEFNSFCSPNCRNAFLTRHETRGA